MFSPCAFVFCDLNFFEAYYFVFSRLAISLIINLPSKPVKVQTATKLSIPFVTLHDKSESLRAGEILHTKTTVKGKNAKFFQRENRQGRKIVSAAGEKNEQRMYSFFCVWNVAERREWNEKLLYGVMLWWGKNGNKIIWRGKLIEGRMGEKRKRGLISMIVLWNLNICCICCSASVFWGWMFAVTYGT